LFLKKINKNPTILRLPSPLYQLSFLCYLDENLIKVDWKFKCRAVPSFVRLCSFTVPVWQKLKSPPPKKRRRKPTKQRFRAIFEDLRFRCSQGASPDQSSWISSVTDICIAKQGS